jgi:hypothetical protein
MKLELDLSAQDALASLDALETLCASDTQFSDASARNTLESLRVLRDAFRVRAGDIRAAARHSEVEFEALFP